MKGLEREDSTSLADMFSALDWNATLECNLIDGFANKFLK